jgi:SAM-dependent methyltransferase/uncharacterized protein YbaR (Trm112 family)
MDAMEPRSAPPDCRSALDDILACPDCRQPLTLGDGHLAPCPGCARVFEMQDGVPMLHPSSSTTSAPGDQFFIEEPGRFATLSRRHPRLARWISIPDPTVDTGALPECKRWFKEHVIDGVRGEKVLDLGSGINKVYTNPELVRFDIAPHANAQVVGDGERLPFRDGVFDGVVLDAVLEHLAHPARVVAEVHRVLKPGGAVLAHVPFLYPFHAAPHDYQRYTPAGLRMLFEAFDPVEVGTDRRPGRAVREIVSAYAAVFSDDRTMSYVLRWVTAAAWMPAVWLDRWLSRKRKADHVVVGSPILARKSPASPR